MAKPIAVLVEDDPEQAAVSLEVLIAEDFEVRSFEAAAPVLDYLKRPQELVDLFVLDRRIPVQIGQPAADEVGDELLDQIRADFPDARIIVFTGFASIEQVQAVARGSGQLPALRGNPIDRVSLLEKHQSLEFREQVSKIRNLLQSLEDIEIVVDGGGPIDSDLHRRMVRRVGYHYGAVSVTVRRLSGGLTGAAVWQCQRRGLEGPLGSIVVKQSDIGPELRPMLTELVPRPLVATRIDTIHGLMAGNVLTVFQVAGESPVALMDLLGSEPGRAAEVIHQVREGLAMVPGEQRVLRLDELCAPIISWSELENLLDAAGLPVPSSSLTASTSIGVRHCDLHPGNVLEVAGEAVLIDFDNCSFGAGGIDAITALLSTLVHPDSPIRGVAWPNVEEIESSLGHAGFGTGHSASLWFDEVQAWVDESCAGERERWALTLAYVGRQLRYQDVRADPEKLRRIEAIARRAADELDRS